jgi:hypothetical protein
MKYVDSDQLINLRMVTGNEKKYPVVILNGIVNRWVGFGFVEEGKATPEQIKKYPTVRMV